jgi:hypothetical protein
LNANIPRPHQRFYLNEILEQEIDPDSDPDPDLPGLGIGVGIAIGIGIGIEKIER